MKKMTFIVMLFLISITYAQDKIYVHTATAANTSNSNTYIDHPDLNGNPNADVVFKHVWNPNGEAGVYNDNIDGLWYSDVQNKWVIGNEDLSDMVVGAQFFVYIASDPSTVITHIADAAHVGDVDSYTEIDDPLFNGLNPGPYAVMSKYWNPNNVLNPYNYGFWYNTSTNKRNIYTENGTTIPENAAFKVLVNGTGTGKTSVLSSASNINNNWVVIDYPPLNGNPNATFVFEHFWGVSGGSDTQVTLDKVFGAWYTGTNWAIYTEDGSPMPEGMAFDIIVADQDILGNDEFTAETFSMYPNPANNVTTISALEEITSIKIFNILGQEVANLNGNGNSMQVDVSSFSTGNYIVKVQTENASQSLKLIKQ